MKEAMRFISDSLNYYRDMQKNLKDCERVPPKKYGEALQKKRKRGKRK